MHQTSTVSSQRIYPLWLGSERVNMRRGWTLRSRSEGQALVLGGDTLLAGAVVVVVAVVASTTPSSRILRRGIRGMRF